MTRSRSLTYSQSAPTIIVHTQTDAHADSAQTYTQFQLMAKRTWHAECTRKTHIHTRIHTWADALLRHALFLSVCYKDLHRCPFSFPSTATPAEHTWKKTPNYHLISVSSSQASRWSERATSFYLSLNILPFTFCWYTWIPPMSIHSGTLKGFLFN